MSKLSPTHKWLVEKRARVQGALEHRTRALQLTVARAEPKLEKLRKDVEALDIALQIYDSKFTGESLPPVHAWQGKYGKRGALKAFMSDVLRQRSKTPIQTDELVMLIIDRFGLTFDGAITRRSWVTNTVLRELKRLVHAGLVEPLHTGQSGAVGQWRGCTRRAPTLAELRATSFERERSSASL